jgi:hypothetical protein
VQGPFEFKRSAPLVDLDPVKEMLGCIRDDLSRVHGLEAAAEQLTGALAEIAAAERRRQAMIPISVLQTRLHPLRKH